MLMARIWLRLTAVLLVICLLLVFAAVSMPQDNGDIEAFINAPENCEGDCLMGIRPTVTTVRDAMTHLREHVWVVDVRQVASGTGYGSISWQWSGQQPALVDTNREGRLTFYWENDVERSQVLSEVLIDTVTIYTHMRLYSLQTFYGETENGSASFRPGGNLAYSVIYDNPTGMMNLYTELTCPTRILNFWDARTRMTMSRGRVNSEFVTPLSLPEICENGEI